VYPNKNCSLSSSFFASAMMKNVLWLLEQYYLILTATVTYVYSDEKKKKTFTIHTTIYFFLNYDIGIE
jgi:hypothetical protein